MTARHAPAALILCCGEYPYLQAIQAFVKRRAGIATYDLLADAGGAQALLEGSAAVRRWMLQTIRLAHQQDGAKIAILAHHQDCIVYGGSAAFINPAAERAFHAQQLAKARMLLRASFPRLTVRMFYAHRTRKRIAFAEIVGGRPRARAARRVCTRG